MAPDRLIQLKSAAKYYEMGESIVKALDGVDITIEKGDFVAIMGPSGSGKSTAMNLTGSLDLTTKGDIFLDGENIEEMEESELAQLRGKKIGFIFQQFNLIPNLTAKENVMLPMLFQGIDLEEREERAERLLVLVNLGDRMDHYPNQLSGGQQQRVAIARSLANDPDIILADEPTGNLDSKTGEMVMGFLEDLNKKGRTIIIVTHDPNLAKNHARTIYSLRDGKLESVEKKISGKWKRVGK
jgi:putative ABC transport system ATP-binding protein